MADRSGDTTGPVRDDRAGREGSDPQGKTTTATATTTGGGEDGHIKCSCGQHCGCNPCTCAHSVVSTGVGRAYCKCGPACTCPTCTS